VDCAQTEWLGPVEFLRQFNRRVLEQRIPIAGSFALTDKCNLRCVHCYVGDRARTPAGPPELDAGQVTSLLDQVTEAGCLHLLFTGGEPLLRQDFAEIYAHARQNGLIVTVFTNATLITDSIVEVFRELPPHNVEVSLYGATAATYERITQAPGSFQRCMSGIERLAKGGIHFTLKTVLMTLNRGELHAIEEVAAGLGVRFRLDPAIFARFDGDRAPLELRLPAAEAVAEEFSCAERARIWRDYVARPHGAPDPERLYNCGAGLTTFHIDAHGFLQPCLMADSIRYDLTKGSFLTGWREVIPQLREKRVGADFPCNRCEDRVTCSFCPAFSKLETGAEEAPCAYLCELGRSRREAIAGRGVAS